MALFTDHLDVYSAPPPLPKPTSPPPPTTSAQPPIHDTWFDSPAFDTQPNPNWQLEQGAKEDWSAFNKGCPNLNAAETNVGGKKQPLEHGVRYNDGKPRCDLLPPLPLVEIAKVLTFGSIKYDDHNWRKNPEYSQMLASLQRHVLAFSAGEDNDPETGISHLAHAGSNLLFLLEFIIHNTGVDDRFKWPTANPQT